MLSPAHAAGWEQGDGSWLSFALARFRNQREVGGVSNRASSVGVCIRWHRVLIFIIVDSAASSNGGNGFLAKVQIRLTAFYSRAAESKSDSAGKGRIVVGLVDVVVVYAAEAVFFGVEVDVEGGIGVNNPAVSVRFCRVSSSSSGDSVHPRRSWRAALMAMVSSVGRSTVPHCSQVVVVSECEALHGLHIHVVVEAGPRHASVRIHICSVRPVVVA